MWTRDTALLLTLGASLLAGMLSGCESSVTVTPTPDPTVTAPPVSTILFSETFDEQDDWSPTTCGSTNIECEGTSCSAGVTVTPPPHWSYYYDQEYWNPYCAGNASPGSQPIMQISSLNHYGPSGKAFTFFNESNKGGSGDGWGADGQLSKDFGQDYSEIFAQLKIKFQPGYQWYYQSNNGMAKIFRFYHWDRTGSPFHYFSTGTVGPAYIFDALQNAYGYYADHNMRCEPRTTEYYCNTTTWPGSAGTDKTHLPGNPSFANSLGDGNWHVLTWQGKMNSAPGMNDGILRLWYDGTLTYEKTDIIWIDSGAPMVGWNTVNIGGNAFNNYMQITTSNPPFQAGAEQWYAIDDIIVSTAPLLP